MVLDSLLAMGRYCLGVTAREAPSLPDVLYVGDDEDAFARFPNGVEAALGLGGTPGKGSSGTALRRRVYDEYVARGFHFPPVVGRGVNMAPDVMLEDGAQVIAGATLQPNVRVGRNAMINTGASVDHDSLICDHAMVGPGAVLCGGVEIGVGAYIGAGAVVLQGVRIGPDAVVAAGAVATVDLDAGGYVSRR